MLHEHPALVLRLVPIFIYGMEMESLMLWQYTLIFIINNGHGQHIVAADKRRGLEIAIQLPTSHHQYQ